MGTTSSRPKMRVMSIIVGGLGLAIIYSAFLIAFEQTRSSEARSRMSAKAEKERAAMERYIARALNHSAFIWCKKIDKKCRAIDYAFSFDRTHLPATKTAATGQTAMNLPSPYYRQFAPISSSPAFKATLPESSSGTTNAPVSSRNSTAAMAPAVNIARECGPGVDYLIADYVYGRIVPVAAPSVCVQSDTSSGRQRKRIDMLPRRGLVLLSQSRMTRHELDSTILPYLEACCNMSFDAIGSGFLVDAVVAEKEFEEGIPDVEGGQSENGLPMKDSQRRLNSGTSETKDISWHMLFFVRDDALLEIERSGPVTKKTPTLGRPDKENTPKFGRVPGPGALMSSNLRFLETLKGAVQVLRKYNTPQSFPITAVVPDDVAAAIPPTYLGSGVVTTALTIPKGALPDIESEYGFRLHKLPMLLKAPFDSTFYVDSDIYACNPSVIKDLIEEMAAETDTDVFCIREGVRKVDKLNYVHGGLLAWRPKSPLARAFLRSWLRHYLVVMRSFEGKRGSIYEQPTLTLVADRTQQVLGPSSVHYFDSSKLARSHLHKGLEPYRQRLANRSFGYAADLIHFNPLKEWPLVQEMVVDAGCGFFRQPLNKPPIPDWMSSLRTKKGL